jgi:hypothetical protein
MPMDTQRIEASLETQEGFKAIFSGILANQKVKASFEIYHKAEKKGVRENYTLRTEAGEREYFAIMAFSTEGAIDKETLDTLTERVQPVSLKLIDTEALNYSRLEPWRGRKDSFANENKEISLLAKDMKAIFLYPVVENKKENLEYPAVIYAYKDGEQYIYPIPARKIDQDVSTTE